MKYYWVVSEEEKYNIFRKPMFLMRSKYNYNFKIGDKMYINEKTGYLGKLKTENIYYPVKRGRNLTMVENITLFNKLYRILYKKILGVKL
jgi:hypothetical protein